MKNKVLKRFAVTAISAAMICNLFTGAVVPETELSRETESMEASAAISGEELFYVSIDSEELTESNEVLGGDGSGEIETASGVTEDMCSASWWFDKSLFSGIGADEKLITNDEIQKLNDEMLHADGAYMNDLEAMESVYNADSLRKSLAEGAMELSKKNAIYANQKLVEDKEAYFKGIQKGILDTGYTDEKKENQYAVAVKRTLLQSIPTDDVIGYSATDADDEKAESALNVNEPFIVRQKASVDGVDFYWGYSVNCTGWVKAEDLAICKDKEEWTDAWKVENGASDFVVVTQNHITLEPSMFSKELSEVKLTFATILKTVPSDQRPENIHERGLWNNYVVYLPTRNEDGTYQKRVALISQHYELSIGFLPMTQKEILRVSFNNLGDRYGWGGMLDSMDCSAFTRNVYRCFGLELPRNTTWQQKIPGRKIDLSSMNTEKKLAAIRMMPAGTLFYFPGHTMIYTGVAEYQGEDASEAAQNLMAYVISDTGTLSDSTGELNVRSMYSVILNPLTARRRAGTTWLENITAAVLPISADYYSLVAQNVETGETEEAILKVSLQEGQAYASSLDSLPMECFLNTTKNIYLSFSNVDESGVKTLTLSAVKGSVFTTKAKAEKVECDKTVATAKINKANSLATLTMKKSGNVIFHMTDGSTVTVHFTVETPKAQTQNIKKLIKEAKESGASEVKLNIAQLFGTGIDGGTLEIQNQKSGNASVKDNVLTLPLGEKNTVRLRYSFLDKKYSVAISI